MHNSLHHNNQHNKIINNDLIMHSNLHHKIISNLHHKIISSLHHKIISSLHHKIISSQDNSTISNLLHTMDNLKGNSHLIQVLRHSEVNYCNYSF
ncbi:metacaspase-like protein, putative [Trichomonas vaginalis G3]|uniref:Metacaspase-like protein, putative n=1 Tax=Trichomonas vaginalis (strain ATCC PRA-98 / G3) TaxID=412133 RepID=A2EBG4_TRIV3|nr:hypothetical protein TVAGG3_0406740 [Trichomonas vaginalis G3]EAY09994.1 metacaspase-like protein, putative [Trichomonas vaginalis G3]KAI5535074.1 hypothetical protein TVAGG3_0406740 [Trichomonas vaginalis G3]|eukprot:XP_001322217.1 metacaspase-like protein [Trichomonas vaginalis G3]